MSDVSDWVDAKHGNLPIPQRVVDAVEGRPQGRGYCLVRLMGGLLVTPRDHLTEARMHLGIGLYWHDPCHCGGCDNLINDVRERGGWGAIS